MMGPERGRLAVTLDMLTDALILIGQHGVYCASTRNPSKPALDLEVVLGGDRRGQRADPVRDGAASAEERASGKTLIHRLLCRLSCCILNLRARSSAG